MKIIFATNNAHKLEEIREILGSKYEIMSLSDIGCHDDIPETGSTIEENARQKAKYIVDKYEVDCFADDTGLEVLALGGEPGVRSARYDDHTDHDSDANMAKLLRNMSGITDRRARFRARISLFQKDKDGVFHEHQFEGEVRGRIDTERHGHEGFGYDPLFIPDGYDKSFAELGEEVKNRISHRARAVAKLAEYLSK